MHYLSLKLNFTAFTNYKEKIIFNKILINISLFVNAFYSSGNETQDILPRVLPLSYISSPPHDIYKCNRINSNNKM